MAISTYSGLKTAIGNWLNRGDLSSYLDDIIDIAEERIFQDLRVREMEDRQEATMSTSSRYLGLPTGYVRMRRLHYTDDSGYVYEMKYVTPEQLNEYLVLQTGKPIIYTIIGPEMQFDRTPDDTYTVQMAFYKKLTALSDANTTNDILTNYPGVYLYGSLVAACEFLERDPTYFADLYGVHVKKANKTDKKGRFSGSTLRMRSQSVV